MMLVLQRALGLTVATMGAVTAATGFGGSAARGADFYAEYSILSALQDTSNVGYPDVRYPAFFDKPAEEGTLFINWVDYVVDEDAWDYGIPLSTPYPELRHEQGTYALGSPIEGEVSWRFEAVANIFGAVDGSVAPGVYDFSIEFRGGADADADEYLGSIPFQVEVFPTLDIVASAVTDPATIGDGGSFNVVASLKNNTGRPFYLSSRWAIVPAFEGPAGGEIRLKNFGGNWPFEVAAGETFSDVHSTYTAEPGLPSGEYTGDLGFGGGVHPGDDFSIRVTPVVTISDAPLLAGDANLDGVIGPDDFALIDRGAAMGLSGWSNGDFDEDGDVDSADYSIINNAFAQQNGAGLMGVVPEPAGVAIGVGTVVMMMRRKRGTGAIF